MEKLFKNYAAYIELIVHAAAQPSHDWAAKEPLTDFSVNANGTLNMLELCRQYCPQVVFIFTSTNKVYGDTPNTLPLVEKELRWEMDESPFKMRISKLLACFIIFFLNSGFYLIADNGAF